MCVLQSWWLRRIFGGWYKRYIRSYRFGGDHSGRAYTVRGQVMDVVMEEVIVDDSYGGESDGGWYEGEEGKYMWYSEEYIFGYSLKITMVVIKDCGGGW